jgi:penicillin-binding protein 2
MGVNDALACTPDFETYGHTYDNFVDSRNIAMNLVQALTESCDTWFYRVGAALYDRTAKDGDPEPQADWGRRLGFGVPTGLDLPGERPGINPASTSSASTPSSSRCGGSGCRRTPGRRATPSTPRSARATCSSRRSRSPGSTP